MYIHKSLFQMHASPFKNDVFSTWSMWHAPPMTQKEQACFVSNLQINHVEIKFDVFDMS